LENRRRSKEMEKIIISGARHHNLKNINVEIPRNKIVVITGLSGSGKSSLAFDTLYAEGQRKYIETLSPFARQFMNQLARPEVDKIEGLSPAVAIEQKTLSRSPRSTVATVSGIYDYLRLLYARVATMHCPQCGKPVEQQNYEENLERVLSESEGLSLIIMAPVVRARKGEYRKLLESFLKKGFLECRIDGIFYLIEEVPVLSRHKYHYVDIVIDKLKVKPGLHIRILNAVALARKHAQNAFCFHFLEQKKDLLFFSNLVCSKCGEALPEIEPKLFSFNSPIGACPMCRGLGRIGEDTEEEFEEDNHEYVASDVCPECKGTRLKAASLSARIGELTIAELCGLEIKELASFFRLYDCKGSKREIAEKLTKDLITKLDFLEQVGLGYLSLDRGVYSLSVGEAQRVRLATQIGTGLRGIVYVLDEPTIGLHPKDNATLLQMLKLLRDQGNTIIIVEHDEATIKASDYVIDLGPGAGSEGGMIVNEGTLDSFMKSNTLTASYLAKKKIIPVPSFRRKAVDYITIKGAKEFNLKNIDVDIPLGVLTVVTGVSGSGKSTLIIDILYNYLATRFYASKVKVGKVMTITGWEKIKRAILVDQSPIGKTPRSNPATYTTAWTYIREFFSRLPESRKSGYTASRFSFNLKTGRCRSCEGMGTKKISMNFLPPSYVVCEECEGKRFNKETLKIHYEGKNIADVLDMTIAEAYEFFSFHPEIKRKLGFLLETALRYLKLGQNSATLSGGEAQRIKLARELSGSHRQKTIYILDEPTTGLHFQDVYFLLQVLDNLVNLGNTVVIIEHNLEVIKSADYVIDLGPGAGAKGGYLVAKGTPEKLACSKKGVTCNYIKEVLNLSCPS